MAIKRGDEQPVYIRLIALLLFVFIVVYGLVINHQDVPGWVMFLLVAIIAGGKSFDKLIDKIIEKWTGK